MESSALYRIISKNVVEPPLLQFIHPLLLTFQLQHEKKIPPKNKITFCIKQLEI